jgi:hypothetical protein
MKRLISILTSLRLTIVLLSFAIALVFFGTLAQANYGLYDAQDKFFKSAFVLWNGIPVLPGGYLIGSLLVINLVAAQAKRTEFTRKKGGLILIHSGIVLMLVGQLATDLASTESSLQLFEGDTKNYSEDFRANELTIIDTSDPKDDQVVVVPDSILSTQKEITHPLLPFTVRVKNYWVNADLMRSPFSNSVPANATEGFLKSAHVLAQPPAKDMDSRSMPAVLVELADKSGKALGSWLLAAGIRSDDTVTVGGKDYRLALRFSRFYTDFHLTLLKATHEKHQGTAMARNFSSRVRVQMDTSPEARETVIYMNNPLRMSGYTFFQHQMMADELAMREAGMSRASSTFQVVKNPSWITPYVACVLVGAGLCWQFGFHLFGFLGRRKKASLA